MELAHGLLHNAGTFDGYRGMSVPGPMTRTIIRLVEGSIGLDSCTSFQMKSTTLPGRLFLESYCFLRYDLARFNTSRFCVNSFSSLFLCRSNTLLNALFDIGKFYNQHL